MKHWLVVTAFLAIIFIIPATAFAQSSYVLPYPSTMPGGISYKLHLVWEKIMQYWYFGDFGQFEYNLKEADKYLVEAKTLFEYDQYLLGYVALEKSNTYFQQAYPHLLAAEYDGKNITQEHQLLQNAAAKHVEVLRGMEKGTPASVVWSPEKVSATTLPLHKAIEQAIAVRRNDL